MKWESERAERAIRSAAITDFYYFQSNYSPYVIIITYNARTDHPIIRSDLEDEAKGKANYSNQVLYTW